LSADVEFFEKPDFWCLLTEHHPSPPGIVLGGEFDPNPAFAQLRVAGVRAATFCLFDHRVGARQHSRGDLETERFGGYEVEYGSRSAWVAEPASRRLCR
jgi:hypothetical protein